MINPAPGRTGVHHRERLPRYVRPPRASKPRHFSASRWAVGAAERFPPPWKTCEAAISKGSHLLGPHAAHSLRALLRRRAVVLEFDLGADLEPALKIMEKYEDTPASVADACIVRMTETLAEPLVLTTDSDFGVYRRHGRKVIPCLSPE